MAETRKKRPRDPIRKLVGDIVPGLVESNVH